MNDLTLQQKNAITAGGNVLVVAGAGTGKTQTLVARCLRLVVEDRVGLDAILLVTFTEAAAAEMRGRLRQELFTLHSARPTDEHLAKQLALLDTARISTLHSFCLQLAREHFHQLGLDPQFSVLDERQVLPLRREALDEILEQHYSSNGAGSRAVQDLIRTVGRGADKSIRDLVLKIHDYAQSLPVPALWLAAQESRFAKSEPDEWRGLFGQTVRTWRDEWLPVLNAHASDIPALTLSREALRALPANPSVAEAGAALRGVLAADAPRENWNGSKGRARGPFDIFFDDAEFLGALAADGSVDPLAEDWAWACGAMTALVGLVREFTARFAEKKRDLGGVDFADLEQLALRLLREPEVAAAWRARLAHILVDEYQDINAAQDAIIAGLSREGREANRFLVGDVKQSIYRFRLANPGIFRTYQEQWDGGLPLTENFRSRESLLNFVNALCASLLRTDVGGVAYEPLVFGDAARRSELAARAGETPAVEFHLIAKGGELEAGGEEEGADETDSASAAPDLLAVEREARLVARRLRELHESGRPIWDKEQKCFRAVKWSDMAVLLRSPAGRAEAFAIEFNRAGVPLTAARDGFFASLEVSDLLNLLRLLDNPLQDVPLAAVLRSPLAGLSADELAALRADSGAKPFWTALRQAGNPKSKIQSEPPGLAGKVNLFLAQFDHWRQLVRQSSLSQCLETALNQTQYETLLLAEARGPERVANVRKLLALARQFDPYQRQGLYRFLRFVRSQEDEELDLPPAASIADDAVRLISVHRSKGLEFPVIALAGLGTQFNERDLGDAVLIHGPLGLCPKIMPKDSEQTYPSLIHWLARRAEKRELRGEELRLLYVALTRARDVLILAGTVNRNADEVRWESAGESLIETSALLKARSHLDWLLLWMSRATRESDWRDNRKGANQLLTWKIYDERDPQFAESTVVAEPDDVVVRRDELLPADALSKLKARLEWTYPFATSAVEPAKTSVSMLRRRMRDETDDEARPLFRFNTPRQTTRRDGGLSAARIGSAHHLFLQFATLENLREVAGVKAEAERLREEELLSAEEMASLDLAALAGFWQSAMGQRILAQPGCVHREIPFTARFSAADLADSGLALAVSPDEFVVVQGVVDLAVILPREIWLVDFKTDAVKDGDVSGKAKEYELQLKLYARALSRIYRRPVTECCLYFLSVRKAFSVT